MEIAWMAPVFKIHKHNLRTAHHEAIRNGEFGRAAVIWWMLTGRGEQPEIKEMDYLAWERTTIEKERDSPSEERDSR